MKAKQFKLAVCIEDDKACPEAGNLWNRAVFHALLTCNLCFDSRDDKPARILLLGSSELSHELKKVRKSVS